MKTIALLIVLTFASLASAQQYSVSDVQALELVFVTTCQLPTHGPNERSARQAHLAKYQFADSAGVGAILTAHCREYQAVIDENNRAIDAAITDAEVHHRDWTPGLDQDFILRKNAIVTATANKLKAAYPSEYDGFMARVQNEKQNMTHVDEGAMMPGMVTDHRRRAPQPNAYQNVGQYSDYGYTVYANISGDSQTMWVSTAIIGTSSNTYWCTWDSYHNQYQPQACSSILHDASLENFSVQGGAPVQSNELYNPIGPSVNPSGYIDWVYTSSPPLYNFNYLWMADNEIPQRPKLSIGGYIRLWCTVAAAFIVRWPIQYTVMEAYTKGYIPTNTGTTNVCQATTWCTVQTTPPFYNFNRLILVPSTAQCYRVSNTFRDGYEVYSAIAGSGNKNSWHDTGLGWSFATIDDTTKACDTWNSIPVP